jgi:hypothetical protein
MPKLSLRHTPPRRWTSAHARTVLNAQRASGLTIDAFAAKEGWNSQRLYFWKRRLATESGAPLPAFVEVVPRTAGSVEVALRNGRILRVAVSIDVRALRRLADALEDDAPC